MTTCENQGTPTNLDDTYTATVIVTGENANGCFNYEVAGISGTANYGELIILNGLLVADGDQTMTVTDCEDEDCGLTTVIVAPEGCSEPCDLEVAVFNDGCDDMATSAPEDDTFSGTFRVFGTSIGDCFTYTINGESFTGTYNALIPVGPFLITDGDVTIEIQDCATSDCTTTVMLDAPESACSGLENCTIACPPDVNSEDIGLSCGDVDAIFNNPSSVAITGEPLLDGTCEVANISFEDELSTLEGCSNVTIIRTFTVETVMGEVFSCQQQIFINDLTAPQVSCPPANFFDEVLGEEVIVFPVDVFECTATIEVPVPTVTDDCGTGWSVETELTTLNGTVLYTIGADELRIIPNVAVGDYYLRYYVTDDCGNAAEPIDCRIRVQDQDPPTAICVSGLDISVGAFGLARLYTSSIDNGSYDDCDLDRIEIRRMYTRDPVTCDTLLTPTYSEWGDFVDFTCCDAGLYVTVELRVVDLAGNVDICSTEVFVRDNTLPFCTGLFSETLTCDELPAGFDPYSTDDLSALFGDPEVVDNCSAEAVELSPVVNLSDCGDGTIIRRFTAIDRAGNESAAIFEQLITIDYILNYSIRFPEDLTTSCMDEIPVAEAFNVGCDSITVTYVDTPIQPEGNECLYIERTYTVTNWCEWNGIDPAQIISRDEDCDLTEGEEDVWVIRRPSTTYVDRDAFYNNTVPAIGERGLSCTGTLNPTGHWRQVESTGKWQYTQRIRVFDNTAPIVNYSSPEPFCTDTVDCEVLVDLPFTVTEYCLPDSVTFNIQLDMDADGIVDVDLTNDDVLFLEDDTFHIRTIVPLGSHIMEVLVTDGCGNVAPINIPFQVVDCYIPELNCFSGLIVNLEQLIAGQDINDDGLVDNAGVILDAHQLASCNLQECNLPLRFSVNKVGEMADINQESIGLTCDDRSSVELEVYVWDAAYNPYSVQPNGALGGPNYASCIVEVFINDDDGVCEECEDGEIIVAGDIYTSAFEPVAGVEVKLEAAILAELMTEDEGKYEFADLPAGDSYTIRPFKNDDTANGITTLDMIRLQNHLLNEVVMTDPYLLIAADVNNSGSVTTLDLIQLRRLILGDIAEFTNNTSWRFIPTSFEFPNPANPWSTPFPEWITITDLDGCMYQQNFMAIKVGDLNGSAVANSNAQSQGDERSELPAWKLLLEDTKLKTGRTYELKMLAPYLHEVAGFQFTLELPLDKVELVEVKEGLLLAEHLGTVQRRNGLLTVSWERSNAPVQTDELFTLVLRAKQEGELADWAALSSRFTLAEAYERDAENAVRNIELGYFSAVHPGMALYQNVPNPVTSQTIIPFDLPEDGEAIIELYDVSGRRVMTIRDDFMAGENEVRVKAGTLNPGVYSYTLRFGSQQLSRKMIVTE